MTIKVPTPTALPPLPDHSAPRYLDIEMETNSVPNCFLDWDCGCGEILPHWGHEFNVQWKPTLTRGWQTIATTNQPPVAFPPGFARVGCHLGNWPPNGAP